MSNQSNKQQTISSETKELSGIWKGIVLFSQSSKASKVKTIFKVQCNHEDCSIDFTSLVIKATSRLDAVIKLREYLNEQETYPYIFSSYLDESFNEILEEYDDIDALDMNSIFESEHINTIIDTFVEDQFNNDSLCLVQCEAKAPKETKSSKKTKASKKTLTSFNETGKEVSKIRKYMLKYLNKNKCSVVKYYKMKYSQGNEYFGIKYDSLVISATSRLEAIFKLFDYFNEHAKYPIPFDAFEDDIFNDIVSEYSDIEDQQDARSVFKSSHITEIIDEFVDISFNNKSLWLEEC